MFCFLIPGEMYTLVKFELGYDPRYATPGKPFVNWMVTNILMGNVDLATTVIPYFAAIPLFGTYRPQLMLYKQTKRLPLRINPFRYTPLCTDIGYRER